MNRKRMATVAAVYSIERQVRTPESVMGVTKEEDAQKPRARNKRVWASVERCPEQVTEEVFQEALRRDPERERPWLMLVDGHEEQLGQIRAAIDRHGVEVTLVLDFIHVLEYLWKAAWCFFVPGCEEAEAWVGERALQILRGKARDVAAGMRRSATPAGPLPRPAQGGRQLRRLSPQVPRDAALRSLSRRGFPHCHRDHRRGLSSPCQRPHGHHRGALGPA
jgi:hypothetical protein